MLCDNHCCLGCLTKLVNKNYYSSTSGEEHKMRTARCYLSCNTVSLPLEERNNL